MMISLLCMVHFLICLLHFDQISLLLDCIRQVKQKGLVVLDVFSQLDQLSIPLSFVLLNFVQLVNLPCPHLT